MPSFLSSGLRCETTSFSGSFHYRIRWEDGSPNTNAYCRSAQVFDNGGGGVVHYIYPDSIAHVADPTIYDPAFLSTFPQFDGSSSSGGSLTIQGMSDDDFADLWPAILLTFVLAFGLRYVRRMFE